MTSRPNIHRWWDRLRQMTSRPNIHRWWDRLRQRHLRGLECAIFLSYRRNNTNPTAIADELNHQLYRGAVYIDTLDENMRAFFDPKARLAPYGAASLPPATPGQNEAIRNILDRRIQEAEFLLLLFDRYFPQDLKAAGELARADPYRVDWVREEMETALRYGKEIMVVYGDAREVLVSFGADSQQGAALEANSLYLRLAADYRELLPVLPQLIKCESVVIEFGDPDKKKVQLGDLVRRLKNRLLSYHRAARLQAERRSRRWRNAFLGALAMIALLLWCGYHGSLQDWLRWRVPFPSREYHFTPQFADAFFKSEAQALDTHDQIANQWKQAVVEGFRSQDSNQTLMVISSDPFRLNYDTTDIFVAIDTPYWIQHGAAFLVAPGSSEGTHGYRQLPAKFHTSPTESGKSLVTLPSPNQGEHLLLLLSCKSSTGQFPPNPNQFGIVVEVQ
jgi:hypothetical protein